MLLLLALAWRLTKELEIIYASALFAVVLMPIVLWITRLEIRSIHPSRPVAIILLIAIVAAAFTLFFTIGLPPVLRDIKSFSDDLPAKIPDIVAKLKRIPLANRIGIDAVAARAENAATVTATYLVTSLPNWLSHVFDILTAAFLCVYFMLEGEHAYKFFLSLFGLEQRRRLDATLQIAEIRMSKWLLGQGLLMVILG
ncbi:MAG: AI-2E family transporter, partial [Granulicella sp.]